MLNESRVSERLADSNFTVFANLDEHAPNVFDFHESKKKKMHVRMKFAQP